jgi:prefoldin subunit 5
MTEKENKVDKLSKNYRELDTDGKETLLKIGEKVFTVKKFVNKEVSLLIENNDVNKEFENE